MGGQLPVCTIGHSTRSLEEFVALLRLGGVTLVADIRSVPKSRTNPQYNLDRLPEGLAAHGIDHRWLRSLGGLRGRARTIAPEVNGFWQNRSFRNYADYALSDSFREGIKELLELSATRRSAIMCSEAVWWRCHRRIVADYLILHGREVLHLMGAGRIAPARMTSGAQADGDRLVYPAGSGKADVQTSR